MYATKAGRLHEARAALEASTILNQPQTGRPTFPHVQHWPTLDLLIRCFRIKLSDFALFIESETKWASEIRPFKVRKHLKSGLFEGQISDGPALAMAKV